MMMQKEREEVCEIQEVPTPVFPIPPVLGPEYCLPCSLELVATRKVNRRDLSISIPVMSIGFSSHGHPNNNHNMRVLLNSTGIPLLSAYRKSCSFLNKWDVFRGEEKNSACALFSVKRSSYFQMKTSLHVFLAPVVKEEGKPDFKVKGDFSRRTWVVLKDTATIAEIKPKDKYLSGPAWKNPFVILVSEGIDHAFILALALILDEIHLRQLESRGALDPM